MSAVLQLSGVDRYHGSPPVAALRDIDLTVRHGEFVAIVGASGSGKSTLLNLMGTLDRPTAGSVLVDGVDASLLDDDSLSALRAHRIGFVFQQFHLADGVPILDSVADGLLYQGVPRGERRARARIALERVGLAERVSHRPSQLSGGERQRAAIARAVVSEPAVLLADEPTGNLDSVAGASVVELFSSLHARGTTIVLITHDRDLAHRIPRRVVLKDGRIADDSGRTA